MKTGKRLGLICLFLGQVTLAADPPPIVIYYGYITQIHCKGTLYTSSVGSDELINLEPIPKNLGCGVLLQPEKDSGFTDVLLKTNTGDMHRIIEIKKSSRPVTPSQLEIWLSPDGKGDAT